MVVAAAVGVAWLVTVAARWPAVLVVEHGGGGW